MRHPHSSMARREVEIKMTPMIDVVFLLLIFFVCTASFRAVEQIVPAALATPASGATAAARDVQPDLERIVIQLRQAGGRLSWTVNQRPYDSLDQVREQLAAIARIDPTLPVIFNVDGAVAIVYVIELYDACHLAGLHRIHFAASAA